MARAALGQPRGLRGPQGTGSLEPTAHAQESHVSRHPLIPLTTELPWPSGPGSLLDRASDTPLPQPSPATDSLLTLAQAWHSVSALDTLLIGQTPVARPRQVGFHGHWLHSVPSAL